MTSLDLVDASPTPPTPAVAPNVAVAVMRRAVMAPSEVITANETLESATPQQIINWAAQRFGQRLVMTASFADTTLIDIATAVVPDIEVIFLDTGFHFAQTLGTVRAAMARYALNLTVLRPEPEAADLWGAGSDACCAARKVDPLANHLVATADAWLSGLRRADSPARATAPIVSIDRRNLIKINPLANLDDADYERYIAEHDVLVNPLAEEGYGSIGCWPCTEPNAGRSGRWAGSGKTECGLHL